jgi:hypothetical protein
VDGIRHARDNRLVAPCCVILVGAFLLAVAWGVVAPDPFFAPSANTALATVGWCVVCFGGGLVTRVLVDTSSRLAALGAMDEETLLEAGASRWLGEGWAATFDADSTAGQGGVGTLEAWNTLLDPEPPHVHMSVQRSPLDPHEATLTVLEAPHD